MERIFHHYRLWEDYKSGMYEDTAENEQHSVIMSLMLLTNADELMAAMMGVINHWEFSSEFSLTNISLNRRAWLGQAACCFKCGVPEKFTRAAWNKMTKESQKAANAVADAVIQIFEERYSGKE